MIRRRTSRTSEESEFVKQNLNENVARKVQPIQKGGMPYWQFLYLEE